MEYLVTTKLEDVLSLSQVVMVDGTVPGWKPFKDDYHWDHHRPDGPDIQVADIPADLEVCWADGCTIVTTQLDADACVAAAWLQLSLKEKESGRRKLEAIAYDCDHLIVPPNYSDLAEFAAKAVAALKESGFALAKQLNLPENRTEWTDKNRREYYSLGFKLGTWHLIDAVRGNRPWPGESGEADEYFKKVETDAKFLAQEKRATLFEQGDRLIAVGTTCGMGRYVDPRSFIKAWQQIAGSRYLEPFTLTARDHKDGGASYTLGSIPLHERLSSLDFTDKIFAALTEAEKNKNPDADGWGGRKTVGGSGWNTSSRLTIEEVLEIVSSLV